MRERVSKDQLKKILIETFIEYINMMIYFIINGLDKLSIIIQIFVPVIIVYCLKGNIVITLLISCITAFICRYLNTIGHKVKRQSDDGIPVSEKRYTKVDDNGFIFLEDPEEAMQYLCDIENYLQERGYIKRE